MIECAHPIMSTDIYLIGAHLRCVHCDHPSTQVRFVPIANVGQLGTVNTVGPWCGGPGVRWDLSCPLGSVIGSIDSVFYGRSDKSTCPQDWNPRSMQNSSCSLPTALAIVREACLNQTACNIPKLPDPCEGVFKWFQATYTCEQSSPPPPPWPPSEPQIPPLSPPSSPSAPLIPPESIITSPPSFLPPAMPPESLCTWKCDFTGSTSFSLSIVLQGANLMKIAATPDLYEGLVHRLQDKTAAAVGLPATSVSLVSLEDSSRSSNGSLLSSFSTTATLNITAPLPSPTSAILTTKQLYAAFLSNYVASYDTKFLAAYFNVTSLSTSLSLGEAPLKQIQTSPPKPLGRPPPAPGPKLPRPSPPKSSPPLPAGKASS